MTNQESFLERTIRWMNHGVKACIADEAYLGAMTLMMANISALASFYSGRDSKNAQPNDHDEFVKFFDDFFIGAHKLSYDDIWYKLEGENKKCILYDEFRCGLIHEHLMKYGTALDKGLTKPYVYISPEGITINIDRFYPDYLNAVAVYSDKVRNDSTIFENFKKRAKYLGAYEPYI